MTGVSLACLRGVVAGRALEDALAADLRVVENGAELRFHGLAGGLLPMLARMVGPPTAARWAAGAPVAAEEAILAGFALAGPAAALEAAIGAATPVAIAAARRLVNGYEHRTLDETLDLEDQALRECLADPESARRVAAWAGGRVGLDTAAGPDLASERHGTVRVAILSRWSRRNALRERTVGELATLLAEVDTDPDTTALVLTSQGHTFCAGEDLRELAVDYPSRALALLPAVQDLTRRMARSRKVVVAALPGPALGLGAELAIACHAQVAVQGATLAFPEARLGLLPSNGAFTFVPRCAGPTRALAWFLTGWPVPVEEAARLGLVTRVVPSPQLLEAALALAEGGT